MQLVIELLKKIFVALSGIYTKQESDAQLAVKADKAEVEAEAQARQEADEAHTQSIDLLKLATDGDWKTYMLARAALTGEQKNIDMVNRAINEYGKDNAALLPNRLIEDWMTLYVGYEAWLLSVGYKSKLGGTFWLAYFDAVKEYEADTTPAELVLDSAPTSPIVNLTATSLKVPTTTNVDIYCPNVLSVIGLSNNYVFNSVFIFPKLNNKQYSFYCLSQYNQPTWFPGLRTQRSTLEYSWKYNAPVFVENIINADALVNNCRTFNRSLFIPKCTSAVEIFRYTAVSAENIAKTLNSLPTTTTGKFGLQMCAGAAYTETTETFTATDDDGVEYSVENCPTFVNDDAESSLRRAYVLAISKKGWEINLQNA